MKQIDKRLQEFDDLSKRGMTAHERLVGMMIIPAMLGGAGAVFAAKVKAGVPRGQAQHEMAAGIRGLCTAFPLFRDELTKLADTVDNAKLT